MLLVFAVLFVIGFVGGATFHRHRHCEECACCAARCRKDGYVLVDDVEARGGAKEDKVYACVITCFFMSHSV
jgi:hypothetical protein